MDLVFQRAMQSPQKGYGQAQNNEVRNRIEHANGDELSVEIDASGLDPRIPIRADRYALKDDDEGSRNGIAQDESGEDPEADLELLARENAVVEEKDGKLDGDHRGVVEDFGGDLTFCERYRVFDRD